MFSHRKFLIALAATAATLVPAAGSQAAEMYFSDMSGHIGTAKLDGTVLNADLINAGGTHMASDGRHLYWANWIAGTIDRSNLDGTGRVALVTGADRPLGIAVDGTHVYWSAFGTNSIGRANLDGTGANHTFLTGAPVDIPTGLAVDGTHLYWGNATPDGGVARAKLDGSDATKLYAGSDVEHVAVNREQLFFTRGGNRVSRMNLDGSDLQTQFIAGTTGANGLAVDDRHVYWTSGRSRISRADLDGTDVVHRFIDPVTLAYGLTLDRPAPALSRSQLDLGDQPLGTGETWTFTVRNDAQHAPMRAAEVAITGANAADFTVTAETCTHGPVAAGERCAVTLRFAPKGTGPRTATVTVKANEYANAPLDVELSGTGTAPRQPEVVTVTNTVTNTTVREVQAQVRITAPSATARGAKPATKLSKRAACRAKARKIKSKTKRKAALKRCDKPAKRKKQ